MDKVITDQSSEPLFEWLTGQFEGHDFAPPRKAQHELAYLAAWYVRVYFAKPRPLRRAFIANKLGILSRNLHRAARAASELGEDGIAQVLLASGAMARRSRQIP